MQDKELYYKKAIEWGEEYLRKNTEPKVLRMNDWETVTNDIAFVEVCLERIKTLPPSSIRRAEYELLRRFKNFIEKLNKKIDLIDKIV